MSRITPDNLDKWLFNLHEGNLSSYEKKELDQFLNLHPEFREESEVWEKSKIQEPLASISYEEELLAIAGTSGIYTYRRWAAAAALLLLLGGSAFYFLSGEEENNDTNTLTVNNGHDKNSSYDNTYTHSTGNNSNSGKEKQLIASNNDLDFFIGKNNSEENYNSSSLSNSKTNSVNNKKSLTNNQTSQLTSSNENIGNSINGKDKNKLVNGKNRKQVSINIQNEINIKTEKTYELITENNPESSNEMTAEELDRKFEMESEMKARLVLKENHNNQILSDNKNAKTDKKGGKHDGYKLNPNPTFTNLRDPQLLMTSNNLINQYGGFSGGMISSRFSLNYRNNWTGKNDINSQNMMFGYDKLLRKLKTGIGFTAFYNDYSKGMFTTMGAALTISPKFKLGRGTTLEPAVTFSYAQKNVNSGRAVAGSFIEDRRGNVLELYRNGMVPAVSSAYMPDMKIGAVFQHKKFWAATSIDHLLTPKELLYTTESNMYNNEIEFKATLGTDYLHRPESGNVYSPQVSFYHHDGYTEMWLGMNARLKQFSIGASFSQFTDYLATIGYQTHSFKMFYQFDMTRSMLMNEKIASHEIGMRFALNGNNRGSKSILNSEK